MCGQELGEVYRVGAGGMNWEIGIDIHTLCVCVHCVCVYTVCVCVCVCVLSPQSCSIFCDTEDHSPPGSSVHKFSRQEYWSGLPCPPPGDLPHPGIKPASVMSPELAGGFFTNRAIWEAPIYSVEWVAYPFSRGFSSPRNQTRVSCIVGRFFTSWATREAPTYTLPCVE